MINKIKNLATKIISKLHVGIIKMGDALRANNHKLATKIKKVTVFISSLGFSLQSFALRVFAEPVTLTETGKLVGKVLYYILQVFMYGGIVCSVFGVISLLVNAKDDNPDKQQRAIWALVIGVCLVTIRFTLGLIFNPANGFDIEIKA